MTPKNRPGMVAMAFDDLRHKGLIRGLRNQGLGPSGDVGKNREITTNDHMESRFYHNNPGFNEINPVI
jgi:hypothetical protein